MKMIAALKTTVAMLMIFGSTGAALALQPAMFVTGPTAPPIGHVQFCSKHKSECDAYARPNRLVRLNDRSWAELQQVNLTVNTQVLPATDMQIFGVVERWEYPKLAGDCEDYVLEKRRDLIKSGWPESALLVTVVRDEAGDGHAVLTVRTDRGDLILDNKDDTVRLWSDTPYRYIKRQSSVQAANWEQIEDGRDSLVGSLR